MIDHPCKVGPNGAPCNRFKLGEAYSLDQCRLCWLAAHDARYSRAWGGDGRVTSAPSVAVDAPPAAPKPMFLGDIIKAGLDKVGMTQERAAQWLGCCNCKERQARLNQLHQWAQEAVKQPVEKAWWALKRLIG